MLKRVYIACAIVLAIAGAPAAHAASLDPSFGTDGRVIVDLGGTRTATAGDIAVQPDGKIVVSGWVDGGFGVVRLLPDGKLDPAFGIGGAAVPVFGEQDRTGAAPPRLALQPDGSIVVAGPAFSMPPVPNPKPDFGVMRLTPAGALDPTFGQGGEAVFQVGPNADLAQDVAIQPDGKIVVAGYSAQADGQNTDFSAIRLTPTGRLDTSFGNGGVAIMPTIPDSGFESLSSLALLPDGRILLAGVSARPATAFDVTVMRMTATGQPDLTFGDQGRTVFPLGAGAWSEAVRALALLPDGSFYTAGFALVPDFSASQLAVARFTPSGVPDMSFASGGQLLQSLGGKEDGALGIVLDGARTWLAVDTRAADGTRRDGVLELGGGTFLFNFTALGNDRVAGLARRADGALVELATVQYSRGQVITDNLAVAVILPNGSAQVTPPPPTPPVDGINPAPAKPRSVIRSPRRSVKLRRVVVLSGTASAGMPLQRVEIALVRRLGRKCMYLRTKAPAFHAKCSRVWLRANGRASWRYALRKKLPRGSYTLYSRAVAGGVVQSPVTRITFSVR